MEKRFNNLQIDVDVVTYNWNKFKRKIFVKTNVQSLFNAWVQSGEITKWFIKICEDRSPDGNLRDGSEKCQVGDNYYWRWHQDLELEVKYSK